MRARRKGSTSWWVLLVLEKAVDGYIRFEDFMFNPGYYYKGDGWEYPLKKSSLSQALKRLREKGLIEQIKLKNDILFKLTQEGKDLLEDKFDEKSWDGRWRVVIFDIPEEKRIIRNLFRRNLKKWGFKHLQKSVWISKRNVFDKLEAYIKDLGIEKWVVVMEVNRLSGTII